MYGYHGDPGFDPLGYGLGVVVRLLGRLAILALIWVFAFHQMAAASAAASNILSPLTSFTQHLSSNLGG